MFGKSGVFCDGLMFAMVADDTLYFRVDDHNREAFAEAEAFPPLNYEKQGRTIDRAFWRAPDRVFDEPDELVRWARAAMVAAQQVAENERQNILGCVRRSKKALDNHQSMIEHMFVTLKDQSSFDDSTDPWSNVHVATVTPGGWSETQVLAGLKELERIRREADAATAVLIGALPDDRDATARIVRATGVSAHQARQQRSVAAVIALLPAAQPLLASGAVSGEHIAALRPVMNLDDADALAFTAIGTTPEVFRRDVEQFRLAHEHGDDTAARQHVLRRLRFFAGPEGTIGFTGLLPPHEGATLKTMLDAIVDAQWKAEHPDRARILGGHDGPTREQRLADALLELTGIAPTGAGLAEAEPDASTQQPTRVTTAKPATIVVFDIDKYEAEMLDHGPVPVTASLFDDARRSLYLYFKNAKGEILKFGRARRDPTIAQRLAVMVRDRHCQFGNCETPASMCDVHHLNEWLHDNGFTDVEVLALFCHPHHRHIHINNLKATREADGTVTITDRTTGTVVARASPKRVAA